MSKNEKGRKIIYDKNSVRLEEKRIKVPHAGWIDGMSVITLSDGVIVVPIVRVKNKVNIMLISQWRIAMNMRLLEVPAGGMKIGETPEEAAAREVREEAGLSIKKLIPIGPIYMAPGRIIETQYHFIAECNQKMGKQAQDGIENIERLLVPAEKVREMLRNREITDLKSKAALYDALDYLKL